MISPGRPLFMRVLFTCLMVLALVGAAHAFTAPPRPGGPVGDYAQVLTAQGKKKIEEVCLELRQKTGAALVVATVPDLQGQPMEEAAVEVFKTWGIGQKGKDDGLLILISAKERRLRIEVGYGLEGYITDAFTGRVRERAIIPFLKKNQWDQGLLAGTVALSQAIAKEAGVELSGVPRVDLGPSTRDSGPVIFIVLIVLLSLLSAMSGRARGGRGGRHGLLAGLLLGSMLGGGHSGGGGFGGFGGGFGGFGGGMSGGGGVSGGF